LSDPTPVKLYDYLFSGNGYKARLAMAQLGIEVEYEFRDLVQGETRTPDFLALSPAGQIPVLVLSDGTALSESNAILCWLTEDTFLMPADKLERAQVLKWMFYEQSNIDKVLGRSRFMRTFPDFIPMLPQGSMEVLKYQGDEALKLLEATLSDRTYLVGERYSAADIAMYAYVHCAGEGDFDLGDYTAVSAWCRRVAEQPGHITIDQVPR